MGFLKPHLTEIVLCALVEQHLPLLSRRACQKRLAGWETRALFPGEAGSSGLCRPIFQSDSNDGRQERKAAVAWPGCRPKDLRTLEHMTEGTTNILTVLPSWLAQGRRDAFWEISAKDF